MSQSTIGGYSSTVPSADAAFQPGSVQESAPSGPGGFSKPPGRGGRTVDPKRAAVAGAVILALVGGGTYALLSQGDGEATTATTAPSVVSRSPKVTPTASAADPQGATPEATRNPFGAQSGAASVGTLREASGAAVAAAGGTTTVTKQVTISAAPKTSTVTKTLTSTVTTTATVTAKPVYAFLSALDTGVTPNLATVVINNGSPAQVAVGQFTNQITILGKAATLGCLKVTATGVDSAKPQTLCVGRGIQLS